MFPFSFPHGFVRLELSPVKSELAHAPVGHQLGANDERRVGRCQIQHSARDFLGRPEALEGDLGLDARRDFRELLRRETQAATSASVAPAATNDLYAW
jgi:hypothetical protein